MIRKGGIRIKVAGKSLFFDDVPFTECWINNSALNTKYRYFSRGLLATFQKKNCENT
jgi:hypothetical protein